MNSQPLTLPKAFESVLLAYLKQAYLNKGKSNAAWNVHDTKYFSRGIVELNKAFTTTRSKKAFNYLSDPVMRSGYLAYFLPVNAMKAYGVLSRSLSANHLSERIRIADVGAGPLTLTIGFLFRLAEEIAAHPKRKFQIQIEAFEQNAKILADGKNLIREYLREAGLQESIRLEFRDHVGLLQRELSRSGTFDIMLLGNILNEFDERGDQIAMVRGFLERHGKPDAVALFLEPGSKKFTRDLQALRDALIAETDYRVLAPCLHQQTCPLNLTAKSDWCNFTQRWSAPGFIRDFDELTHLKKEYLLYAYLLLQRKEAPLHDTAEFVAISDLMKQKGRLELLGCGPAGRVRFMRSNRDATESNSDFGKLTRGSCFTAPDYKHNGEYNLNLNVPVRASHKILLN